MMSWSYENPSDKKKTRALFALLNLELDKHFTSQELMRSRRKPGEISGWDIDHIMPSSRLDEKWVHKLGNLTLLAPGENRSAGNKLPVEKIEQSIYNNSMVFLTKICDDIDKRTPLEQNRIRAVLTEAGLEVNYKIDQNWDQTSTEQRAEFLIDWARWILVGRYQ